jgi:hypothetical protein
MKDEGCRMKNQRRATGDVLAAARMDKSVLTVGTFDDDDTREYWVSRTPQERMEALELLRMISYGYDPTTARLRRVLEIVELGES